jgi:peptidoglycan-associated lipoprotein
MMRRIYVFLCAVLAVGSLMGCAAQEGNKAKQAGAQAAQTPIKSNELNSLEAFRRGQKQGQGPLKDVYFDYDRSYIRPDARNTLQANSLWLKQYPSVKVEIEGHADARGTNEYNLALGARRAQAVRDYLVTLGNSPGRLSTISYGEELPVCTERTEACYQLNRRAHFVILSGKPTS